MHICMHAYVFDFLQYWVRMSEWAELSWAERSECCWMPKWARFDKFLYLCAYIEAPKLISNDGECVVHCICVGVCVCACYSLFRFRFFSSLLLLLMLCLYACVCVYVIIFGVRFLSHIFSVSRARSSCIYLSARSFLCSSLLNHT